MRATPRWDSTRPDLAQGREAFAGRPARGTHGGLIPIRDSAPGLRFPLVTTALVGAIAAAFAGEVALGRELERVAGGVAFVPAELAGALEAGDGAAVVRHAWAAVLSLFVHGGWLQAAGNLLYLRAFGGAVEDRVGRPGLLAVFLGAGLAASVAQLLAGPGASTPVLGAEGGVAGIIGAHVVLRPLGRVLALFPVLVFLTLADLPALAFLPLWGLQQLLYGYLPLEVGPWQGPSWVAQAAGLGAGALAALIVRLRRRRR